MLNIIRRFITKGDEQRRIDKENFERFTVIRYELSFFGLYVSAISEDTDKLIELIHKTIDDCRFVEENKWSIARFNDTEDTKEGIDECINIRRDLETLEEKIKAEA